MNTYLFAPGKPVFDNLSIYAQDHWRVTSALSLDYGLRWEFNPAPAPSNGFYPASLTSSDLATALIAPAGTPPYKTTYDHFAPRFGFAWNAIPSTNHAFTVRGGFGLYYDTAQSTIGNAYTYQYPFTATRPAQQEVPLPLSNTALAPPALGAPLTIPYPYLAGLTVPDLTLPYTEQWNLSLDAGLSTRNTLTVSYVGNNGRKLLFTQNYGGAPEGNLNFANGLVVASNASESSYNGLQVQDRGRIASGLDVVASFTWAHALDNASSDEPSFPPTWGNSAYDLRRVVNVALNYKSPGEGSTRWMRALTRGWLLANRFAAQSGYPLDLSQGTFTLPNGAQQEIIPDLVPGVPIYLHGAAADVNGEPVPGNWRLNSEAFAPVPTDADGNPIRQGTLGRNYIRNPGFWVLNTAVERSLPIRDRLNLIIRLEAFNIFNHPNLGNPDTYLPDSTFGQLVQGSVTTIGAANNGGLYSMGSSRSLQISLKLQF